MLNMEIFYCFLQGGSTIKSGLTGIWQVSGRSDITDFEEIVKLDLEYINNWSLISSILGRNRRAALLTLGWAFHFVGDRERFWKRSGDM